MKSQRNVPNEIKSLKSLANIYLSEYGDFITDDEANEIINSLIKGHCTVKGISEKEYLKIFPYIKAELKAHINSLKFLTGNEGMSLTKDDSKTFEEKKNKIAQLKSIPMWKHWDAYVNHLKTNKGYGGHIVNSIDTDTDNIIQNFPLPEEKDEFCIRGLVCGFVQSGKTMNYAGLINKAIDMGYDIILVLAGIPSILRNQGQRRMEYDVVGIDTLTGRKVGIGEKFENTTPIEIYTKRDRKEPYGIKDLNGDFTIERMRNLPPYSGNKQIIMVVKKNKDILEPIYKWLTTLPVYNKITGKIENHSLLIIDDESDHASINFENKNEEPSTINRQIRKILKLFKKNALVGYTATPFANIFLDPSEKDDLFPKDFIYLLSPPKEYLGPFEFFRMNREGANIPSLLRVTDKVDAKVLKEKYSIHDWDYQKNGINPSLRKAIDSFLITGGIRRLRGQAYEHHSMLIHISVSTTSHNDVRKAVQDYIDDIKKNVLENEVDFEFWKRIKSLWQDDFIKTSRKMENVDSKNLKQNVIYEMDFMFSEVKVEIIEFLKELQRVFKINGEKDSDFLDYDSFKKEHGRGMKVICVGGSILSRGYTIEGLTCSYYTRNSLQFDTVLQCGRFFGYRPGYRDLVRVYTSQENQKTLRVSAQTLFRLVEQFKEMSMKGKTPEEFGFYIEEILEGYKPTSKKRMRKYEPVDTSFSKFSSDVASFILDDKINEQNLNLTNKFIESLGVPFNKEDISWRSVDSFKIAEYLVNLKISKYSRFQEALLLKSYIEEVNKKFNHLKYFDVVLVKVKRNGGTPLKVGGYNIKSSQRKTELKEGELKYAEVNEGRALTGSHLLLSLTKAERALFNKKHDNTNSITENKVRPFRRRRGVLIIYTFCPEHINKELRLKGKDKIKEAPIGLHISLPECRRYQNTKTLANLVYYLNNVLGGNIV